MTTPETAPSTERAPLSLPAQIGLFASTRTVVNTGFRMLGVFLPVLARGMGVNLETAALIVTARSTVGLVSPVMGSAADVWGRRTTMLAALAVVALSMASIAIWPIFPVVMAAMVVSAAAKAVAEPAMIAYISDQIDYSKRGVALAIMELGWSCAGLIGLPLVGLAISRGGWTAPFPWLAGLTLLGAAAIVIFVPRDRHHATNERPSFLANARTVLSNKPALACMAMGVLMTAANENISIVFGPVMEDSFSLQVAGLGLAAIVIGVSELTGEGLVAGLVDRLGKRRSVILGISLNLVVSLLLPAFSTTLIGALVMLFLFYLTFEISVVSTIPLMTELAPSARATMMAGAAAAFSLGRAFGSLMGPALYQNYGLVFSGGVSAILDAAAIALLFFAVPPD